MNLAQSHTDRWKQITQKCIVQVLVFHLKHMHLGLLLCPLPKCSPPSQNIHSIGEKQPEGQFCNDATKGWQWQVQGAIQISPAKSVLQPRNHEPQKIIPNDCIQHHHVNCRAHHMNKPSYKFVTPCLLVRRWAKFCLTAPSNFNIFATNLHTSQNDWPSISNLGCVCFLPSLACH